MQIPQESYEESDLISRIARFNYSENLFLFMSKRRRKEGKKEGGTEEREKTIKKRRKK